MQRVLFCLGMMVTAVCSAHPFLGAELSVVMLLWARVYGKVPVGKYLRMFRLPLGFLALSGTGAFVGIFWREGRNLKLFRWAGIS